MRILIINTFGIGDVLFTTPIIANLKERFPQGYIGYLCNRRTSELLENNPKVNRVFIYERDEFAKIYKHSCWEYLKALNSLVKSIRDEHFDIVIDVSLNGFIGFLAWVAGIPCRTGLDYKNRGFFLTKKIPLRGYIDKHVVEYYLDLLRELDIPVIHKDMEVHLTAQDFSWADEFISINKIQKDRPIIGLAPGGGESWGKDAAYKRWPAEYFSKLADKSIEKFAAQIILFGGPGESQLCGQIAKHIKDPNIVVCAKTSLSQFAALVKRCSLLITNDGGLLHLAVAAGCKTVSIFGPVDEAVYGPYPVNGHKVVKSGIMCQPCYRGFRRSSCEHIRCLKQLSVEEVLELISGEEFLG